MMHNDVHHIRLGVGIASKDIAAAVASRTSGAKRDQREDEHEKSAWDMHLGRKSDDGRSRGVEIAMKL